MACCTKSRTVPSNAVVSAHTCSSWCNVNVERCGAYRFANGVCTYCMNADVQVDGETTALCLPMAERKVDGAPSGRQCFSNTCLACAGGVALNVTHNTTILFSQLCNRYVPFATVSEAPLVYIDFHSGSAPLTNVRVRGPGKLQSSLPIRLGRNFQFTDNIHFYSCNHTGAPVASALAASEQDAGLVVVEGRVDSGTAVSLFMTEPSRVGGEIVFGKDSSITMTPPIDNLDGLTSNVGIAALAHVTGFLDLTCSSPREFVVSQSLTMAPASHRIKNCTLVNLTDLLLDFGREYEIQFYNGPETPSALNDVVTYLFLAVAVLGMVTFIFNQSKMSALAYKLVHDVTGP